MPIYSCTGCSFTVGGTTVPGVVDGSVTLTHEAIDATEITDARRVFIGGVRSGSFSGTIYYDQGNTAIAALESAAANGTTVAFVFTLHTNATYTVSAFITSFAPSFAVNDVMRASISAQFTGALNIG